MKGRLEGGQLYTPAYVARVRAMVRGAARGITVPTNLSALWSTLQKLLQEMDGATGVAVEGSFFQSLFNAVVKEGEVLGSLRAGAHWTPSVGDIILNQYFGCVSFCPIGKKKMCFLQARCIELKVPSLLQCKS